MFEMKLINCKTGKEHIIRELNVDSNMQELVLLDLDIRGQDFEDFKHSNPKNFQYNIVVYSDVGDVCLLESKIRLGKVTYGLLRNATTRATYLTQIRVFLKFEEFTEACGRQYRELSNIWRESFK